MSTNNNNSSSIQQSFQSESSMKWRVIDFVTAAVLAVACGLLFFIWNNIGYAGFKALDALTPGFGGLVNGLWYIGGPLGALIIRKPGAALFVELLAAITSMALGSQWGVEALYAGFAQGIGAEIIFLITRYKRFKLPILLLAGAAAALGAMILEGITGDFAKSLSFIACYWSCSLLSGALLGGLLAYILTKALAKAGALNRFAAGREVNTRV